MKKEVALKILRETHDSALFSVRTALETLIPELAESEDEKIRAEIVGFLNSFCPSYIPERQIKDLFQRKRFGDWVAWLEKQKEQKTEKYSLKQAAEIFLDALSETPYNNKPITDAQVITRELLNFLSNAYSYNPDALYEQKPAEWSEEDEVMLKEIISFFKDGTVKLQHDLDLYAGFLEKRLKSLRPSWKPSEEQMDRLLSIVAALRKDYCDDMADFLASLYKQLKAL